MPAQPRTRSDRRPRRRPTACAAALALTLPALASAGVLVDGDHHTWPLAISVGPGDTLAPGTGLYVGSPGVGSLRVDGGSFLQLARLSLGSGGAGNGSGLLSGAGSRIELVGDGASEGQVQRLVVGDWGQASLIVQQGARLDTATNPAPCLIAFHFCDSFVGAAAGDTARLDLDGNDTVVRIGQNLFIAQPGLAVPSIDGYSYGNPGGSTRGTVNVTGGAALVTDRAQVAPRHWSTAATGRETNFGSVSVSGPGSRWLLVGGARVDNATGVVAEGGANLLTALDRNSWATINVSAGGLIEVQGQDSVYNVIQLSSGGRTDMTVSGAGSRISFASLSGVLQVGRAGGSATLDVRDGGVVDKVFYVSVGRDGGFGTLNVDGAASLVRLDSTATAAANVNTGTAVMDIGRGGGTGVVNLSNGARLEMLATRSTTNGMNLSLGRDAASAGTLNIGSGATLLLRTSSVAPGTPQEAWNPFVRIGRDGNGTLNLSGGGQLLVEGGAASTLSATRRTSLFIGGAGDTTVGGRGVASVAGAGSQIVVSGSDAYIGIGHGPLASGNVTVSDQGRLAATILGVGNFGGTGVLRLDRGRADLAGQYTGSGEFGAALVVGAQPGAVGNVQLLNGSLITIDNRQGTTGGGFTIGGSRTITGGDGSVSLSGGSRIEVLMAPGAGGGTVGRSGSGLLRLSGGSSVDLGQGSFIVGAMPGSDGTVVATDGSTIQAGWVGVGRRFDSATGTDLDGGTGTMVLNGATLVAQDVVIGTNGYLGGSGGAIQVSGSVTNYGIFAPGSSPGSFAIEGDYRAGAGSRLVLEVQDDGQGGFLTDLVRFGGAVDLGDTAIEFRFLGNTDPNAFQAAGGFVLDTFLQQADGQGGWADLAPELFEAVDFSARADAYVISSFDFTPEAGASFSAVPVPEPGAWAMLAAGLAVLGRRARRRGASV